MWSSQIKFNITQGAKKCDHLIIHILLCTQTIQSEADDS